MGEKAEMCQVTQKECGHNGIYCAACPSNPKLLYTFQQQDAHPGWQVCPKCNGRGEVEDYLLGPMRFHKCEVCEGKMIINLKTGKPPGK
jgi:DnaJ-class molecular chaperone